MTEHPHQGVIGQVAHLSQMYDLQCRVCEARDEDDVPVGDVDTHLTVARERLELAADGLMESFGAANVLQTVEETIANGWPIIERGVDGAVCWAAGADRGVPRARKAIVAAIVDTADAAREDERVSSNA